MSLVNHDSTQTRRQRDDEFVELLTRHKSPLFRFIFSLIHSMTEAEDVFQQTTVTLWDKFSEYQPGSDFFAWACTIARYKTLNFFQSQGRERLHFSDAVIDQLASHEEWPSDFHESRLKALAACRDKLSAADQKLLVECYAGRGTILEVADRLGRPVGSVYSSLSRVRRVLHSCIQRTMASEGHL